MIPSFPALSTNSRITTFKVSEAFDQLFTFVIFQRILNGQQSHLNSRARMLPRLAIGHESRQVWNGHKSDVSRRRLGGYISGQV